MHLVAPRIFLNLYSTDSALKRKSTPAAAPPRVGLSRKTQSCGIAWPPTKTAGPKLRAGLTLVPVMWMPSR